jgi:hypothetical protein
MPTKPRKTLVKKAVVKKEVKFNLPNLFAAKVTIKDGNATIVIPSEALVQLQGDKSQLFVAVTGPTLQLTGSPNTGLPTPILPSIDHYRGQ